MEGRHIFDLIKDFRSNSNKILVDYGKFKKWIFTMLKDAKKVKSLRETARQNFLDHIVDPTSIPAADLKS